MKHQTGKKQFLPGACHTIVVTLLLVRDHRALTWEDSALSQFRLAGFGSSFALC